MGIKSIPSGRFWGVKEVNKSYSRIEKVKEVPSKISKTDKEEEGVDIYALLEGEKKMGSQQVKKGRIDIFDVLRKADRTENE